MRGTNQQELRLADAIVEYRMLKPQEREFVGPDMLWNVGGRLKTVFCRPEMVGPWAGKLAGRQRENRQFLR